MASLSDAVARPRVYINTNDIPSEDGNNVTFNRPLLLADAIEKQPEATVAPKVQSQPTVSTDQSSSDPEPSKVQAILDKLFGLHGQERYQLWPEKLARDALSAPHDVMTGQIPQYEVDPVSGEVHTGSGMIKAAQDVSALAGTGGLAGVGGEAGVALGSGPLKTMKVYRAGGDTARYGEGSPTFYSTTEQGAKPYSNHGDQIKSYDIEPNKLFDAKSGEGVKLYKEFLNETNHPAGYGSNGNPLWTVEPDLKKWLDQKGYKFDAIKFDENTGHPSIAMYADSSKPGSAIQAMVNTNKPTLDYNSLDHILNSIGAVFSKDKSGKSNSTYYFVDTPNGKQKIRVSNHQSGYSDPNTLELPVGSDFHDSYAKIAELLGKDIDNSALSSAKKAEAQEIQKTIDHWNDLKSNKSYDQYGPYDYDTPIKINEARLNTLLSDNEAGLGINALAQTNKQIPEYLYHATYEPYFNKIKNEGLIGGKNKNYEDSFNDRVYLSRDPENARSYAETSDMVPDDYLDKIKILKISTKDLDKNKLKLDKNVIENGGDTLEYHGSIPPTAFGEPTNKPFYSAVENAVTAAKQPKADIKQWLSFLKNQPGVKQEELSHLGLDKLQGSITKDDLLKAVQEGQPQINEVIKGGKTAKEREVELEKLGDERTLQQENELSDIRDGNWQGEHGPNATKYHSYQLPGATNYREMLLTLPNKNNDIFKIKKNDNGTFSSYDPSGSRPSSGGTYSTEAEALADAASRNKEARFDTTNYHSSHWDEPNVLAHIRMNDRTIDGKKTLHIEEIQSDWHQEGRKKGYKQDNKDKLSVKNEGGIWRVRDESGQRVDLNGAVGFATEEGARNAIANNTRDIGGVPDAPFKKTWDELALKKAITHAVKNGYDSISWTPGEAQAARYDLSKQVDKIAIPMVNENGTRSVRIDAKDKTPFKLMVNKDGIVEGHGGSSSQFSGKPLSDVVGKEMADKIMKLEKPDEFSGEGLKVGGQGMKAFYDKMLVDKMNALTKKHGGKVERSDLSIDKRKTVNEIANDLGFGNWHSLTEAQRSRVLDVYNIQKPQRQTSEYVHVLKITPELREHVLKKGFPLFASAPIFTPVNHNPFEKDKQ